MQTAEIAQRLVELCRAGNVEQCYQELYAPDAQNLEMPAMASGPMGNAKGLDAIRAKAKAWMDGVETFHSSIFGDPQVAGNWFCIPITMDVSFKGRGRTTLEELAVYQVKDGKIVHEQFFYDV